MRHETTQARNPRMALQVKTLLRLDTAARKAVGARAQSIRHGEVGADAAAPV